MLPYIYSVGYETHYTGLPMMRPMVLEFQEDFAVRDINTQYMLGDAVLVAPVFDQKIHRIYLPEGSWIDLYTKERIRGGRWITAEKKLDTIPLFLRENTALPVFPEAPMHIEDKNFEGYDLLLNLTGNLEKRFYDDDFTGTVRASIDEEGIVTVETDLPVREFRVYADREVTKTSVRYLRKNEVKEGE